MGYNYDVLTNTLSATKGFFDRASRVNTTEYNIIKKLRADNPGMTIKQRPSSTRPHHNITFAQMEHYIAQFPPKSSEEFDESLYSRPRTKQNPRQPV